MGDLSRPRQQNSQRGDDELLHLSRTDPEAFAVFYRRHVDNILDFFWHRTRDHEIAADLCAETFSTALAGLDRFDTDKGNPRQWLYGIATNLLKRFWRRQKTSTRARDRLGIITPTTPTEGWDSIHAADARLDSQRLLDALNRLPNNYREAVTLRVIDNLPYADIGRRLSCSTGAARVRVLRGLGRLQHEFDSPNNLESTP